MLIKHSITLKNYEPDLTFYVDHEDEEDDAMQPYFVFSMLIIGTERFAKGKSYIQVCFMYFEDYLGDVCL